MGYIMAKTNLFYKMEDVTKIKFDGYDHALILQVNKIKDICFLTCLTDVEPIEENEDINYRRLVYMYHLIEFTLCNNERNIDDPLFADIKKEFDEKKKELGLK